MVKKDIKRNPAAEKIADLIFNNMTYKMLRTLMKP